LWRPNGLENGPGRVHIAEMTKTLLLLAGLILLTGCGYDPTKDREACAKLNPGDPAKAAECSKGAEAAYQKGALDEYRRAREIKH
jgi:hypothetical protein